MKASGLGLKKDPIPFDMVSHFDAIAPHNGTAPSACWNGPCSTLCQNAWSRDIRSEGWLPAMMLALIAPIDVPMTQSGSMPASCSA